MVVPQKVRAPANKKSIVTFVIYINLILREFLSELIMAWTVFT